MGAGPRCLIPSIPTVGYGRILDIPKISISTGGQVTRGRSLFGVRCSCGVVGKIQANEKMLTDAPVVNGSLSLWKVVIGIQQMADLLAKGRRVLRFGGKQSCGLGQILTTSRIA